MTEQTYEVIVPMYGYMTLEVEAKSKQEAEDIAFEDCMNVLTDQSDMEEQDANFMLVPHEKIHEGNTSYVTYSQIQSEVVGE